ncbi:unnamed protein product, partial [Prunus brigantina]
VCSRPCLLAKKQRVVHIPHRSSSRLHQSRDKDQTGRTAPPSSNRDPSVEPRVVKHEADLASLTPLETRMAATKAVRESFALGEGVVFVVEAPHSSNVAPSYAQLDELEKKNVNLTGKLSAESRMSEMKKSMFVLKSSLAQKDSELNSSTTTLDDHKGVLN